MEARVIILVVALVLIAILALIVSAAIARATAVGGASASAARTSLPITSLPITSLLDAPTTIPYLDRLTGETKRHSTQRHRYVPPESDMQISTILKYGTARDYGRLVTLLGKFWQGPTSAIHRLLKLSSDREIYAAVRAQKQHTSRSRNATYSPARRNAAQAATIYGAFTAHGSPTDGAQLLDIGCGPGGIAAALGPMLGAKPHGVDFHSKSEVSSDINYTQLSADYEALPYPDSTFDYIVVNMVLHHVDRIEMLIRETARVLKPSGLVYVADHDCWDAIDALLVDIEHSLYGQTVDDVENDASYYKIHRYCNQSGIEEHLKRVLTRIDSNYIYRQLKPDIGASRAFWALYSKSGRNTAETHSLDADAAR